MTTTTFSHLIVGLGNPGAVYAHTRHNIGFDVVVALANSEPKKQEESKKEYAGWAVRRNGTYLYVMQPLTYMNLSGVAVAKFARKHSIPPSNIVVVVDEFNFPVGKIHLRRGGSDGGHNGLRSIIEELGTPDFWRLRCGIGRDFGPGGMVDYVLSVFPHTQEQAVHDMILKAVGAIQIILDIGPDRAIAIINRV